MARFFLPPEGWTEPALTGDEARHFSQVLRGRTGEKITVFDGEGRRAAATATRVSRDEVGLELGEILSTASTGPAITLAQAIPKGKNMDLIVQKAVELGIHAIQPLLTRNTIVQPGDGKAEKWRRTALEACKQCGQDTLPRIFEPLSYDEWVTASEQRGLRLIASLGENTVTLKEILHSAGHPAEIMVLVGPEGDFTPQETQSALARGFHPVSLGNIVLRVETASIFCLSALRYEFC